MKFSPLFMHRASLAALAASIACVMPAAYDKVFNPEQDRFHDMAVVGLITSVQSGGIAAMSYKQASEERALNRFSNLFGQQLAAEFQIDYERIRKQIPILAESMRDIGIFRINPQDVLQRSPHPYLTEQENRHLQYAFLTTSLYTATVRQYIKDSLPEDSKVFLNFGDMGSILTNALYVGDPLKYDNTEEVTGIFIQQLSNDQLTPILKDRISHAAIEYIQQHNAYEL